MYKLMIVDDEPIIIRGLRGMLIGKNITLQLQEKRNGMSAIKGAYNSTRYCPL